MHKFYKKIKNKNYILKTGYLDYKVFVIPEFSEISAMLSGENQKHILIGFADENNPEMDAFLDKIMTAASLHIPTDCLLLKRLKGEALPSFSQIQNKNTINKAVLFGISPKDLGLKITPPQYFPTEFNNCTFLFIDNLSKINTSPQLKKDLWSCLKEMFKSI